MKKFIFLLLINQFAIGLFAQKSQKIGVVLSGGGAKGFAHIGLLHILDSLGVEVEIIGGTSMGSIMGGLYAIGYTPHQLDSLAVNANWETLLQDKPERKTLAPYEKSSEEKYLVALDIDSRLKPKIPAGLNNGQHILNLLDELTIGYHGNLDFKKDLPIQFIAISTALNSGKEVVFTSGSLPKVLRSSMSIPTMFSPFMYDGQYMIDGGSVNNFPADRIQEMGADIIIGSDVQTTFADSISDPTLIKVLEKTGMYMNANTTKQRESICSIIVKPDMKGFGVTSFKQARQIIDEGLKAAREAIPQILELVESKTPKTKAPYSIPDSVEISIIQLHGLERNTMRFTRGNLNLVEGKNYSINQINSAIENLYGTNQFTLIEYNLIPFQDHDYVLHVYVTERKNINQIKLGLHYDPDFESAALVNFTSKSPIFKGDFLSFDLVLSNMPRIYFTYLWDNGVLPGFGLDVNFFSIDMPLYFAESRFGVYRQNDLKVKLYTTSRLSNNASAKLGIFYQNLDGSSNDLLLKEFIELNLDNREIYGPFFELFIDSRNRKSFASRGNMLNVNAKFLVVDTIQSVSNIPLLASLKWENNIPVSNRWTIRQSLFIGTSFFANLNIPFNYNIGGLGENYQNGNVPFYGYHFNEHGLQYDDTRDSNNFRIGNNLFMYGLDLQYQLFNNHYVKLGGQLGYIIDHFDDPDEYIRPLFKTGVGLQYGIHTLFGPIQATVSRSFERNQWLGYISIGYWF